MGQINWTLESEKWLRDIYDYIALDNLQAATRVVDGIHQRVQILRRFPLLGHIYEGHASQRIRILRYGHYQIAYLIRPDSDLDILGVFHGGLDFDRYLF